MFFIPPCIADPDCSKFNPELPPVKFSAETLLKPLTIVVFPDSPSTSWVRNKVWSVVELEIVVAIVDDKDPLLRALYNVVAEVSAEDAENSFWLEDILEDAPGHIYNELVRLSLLPVLWYAVNVVGLPYEFVIEIDSDSATAP